MKTATLRNIDALVKKAKQQVRISDKTVTRTIAFFDLTESTKLKVTKGHTAGTRSARLHNAICKEIVTKFGGTIVKELGDGAIAKFDNTGVKGCIAACNVKLAVKKAGMITKGALTIGEVEEVKHQGKTDIFGTTVDRCSRIASYALPNQILIDTPLYEVAISVLRDYKDVAISKPMVATLKDTGETQLFEISQTKQGLLDTLKTPFDIHEKGRMRLDQKVALMQGARSEIIELGFGLREFTRYFTGPSRAQFREPVENLLSRGVSIKCYGLDPIWAKTVFTPADKDYEYVNNALPNSLDKLLELGQAFKRDGHAGKFEVSVYHQYPLFHTLCIDGDDDKRGRMVVSNYLYGIDRPENPVLQFSRTSNPTLFKTYYDSIKKIVASSKPWQGSKGHAPP